MPIEDDADDSQDQPTPTLEDVQKQLQDEIAQSKKYRTRAQQAEGELTGLRDRVMSDEDRELFNTLRAEREELENNTLKKKGDFDTILAKKQEAWDAALKAEQAKTQAMTDAYSQVAVMTPLQAALAAQGVKDVQAAAHLIQSLHEHKATVKTIDGAPVVQVVDKQGNPVVEADTPAGQSISVAALVKQWVATPTGQHFMPPSGDGGSGAHSGGGGVGGVTLAELDADAQKKADFIQKEGSEAYLKLASRPRK